LAPRPVADPELPGPAFGAVRRLPPAADAAARLAASRAFSMALDPPCRGRAVAAPALEAVAAPVPPIDAA
jgi:hypothetical protein